MILHAEKSTIHPMLSKSGKYEIAICYDFDGTLSPGNMQEYSFISGLGQSPQEFWEDVAKLSKAHGCDLILAYMYLMCARARERKIKITRDDFFEFGRSVEFFPGLLSEPPPSQARAGDLFSMAPSDWFSRMNACAAAHGAELRHYVISSGIGEMIQGCAIARNFRRIFASGFMYDEYGAAVWPAHAVNYTTKMQYLFRINKGVLDLQKTVNHYMPEALRPVPFKRMVFIGDGMTDIPSMKLVKSQGGYSIAVHDGSRRKGKCSEKLLNEDRVNFVARADYRGGSPLDRQVRRVIEKIAAEKRVEDCR